MSEIFIGDQFSILFKLKTWMIFKIFTDLLIIKLWFFLIDVVSIDFLI